jgi:hypothetical protein
MPDTKCPGCGQTVKTDRDPWFNREKWSPLVDARPGRYWIFDSDEKGNPVRPELHRCADGTYKPIGPLGR